MRGECDEKEGMHNSDICYDRDGDQASFGVCIGFRS